jgi:hypothetical protein
LITTTLPTSHGYLDPPRRGAVPTTSYFTDLFVDVATNDTSPFISVPAALTFRNEICGGEAAIREYCFQLAETGGKLVATILGTEVLANKSGSINRCGLVNVLLPLHVGADADLTMEEAPRALMWMQETAAYERDVYFQLMFYADRCWVRLSAQIYLSAADFAWGGEVLSKLCGAVRDGSWRTTMGENKDWAARIGSA